MICIGGGNVGHGDVAIDLDGCESGCLGLCTCGLPAVAVQHCHAAQNFFTFVVSLSRHTLSLFNFFLFKISEEKAIFNVEKL